MFGPHARRRKLVMLAAFVSVGALATPTFAQTSRPTPPDPNPGRMTLTGSFDVVSTYMFRGIRQNATGIALWPVADLGVAVGQADSGAKAGRYLELGVSPGYSTPRASIAVPVKVGLSLGNYYELNTGTVADPTFEDPAFGYFSVAGLVTVSLGGTTGFGSWNVHGGVEYQTLGETTRAFNGGDRSRVIGSAGIGFSY